MHRQNICHKQWLRIGPEVGDKRELEEDVEPKHYDELVKRLRASEGRNADPFFPWVCCVCEDELCIRPENALRALACYLKFADDGSHKICRTCWFEGKDGRQQFAAEDGPHGCPGCDKGWPRADRVWKRNTTKGQPRFNKEQTVTEEAYA